MKKHSLSYNVRRAISAAMTVVMVVGSIQLGNTTIVSSSAEEVGGQQQSGSSSNTSSNSAAGSVAEASKEEKEDGSGSNPFDQTSDTTAASGKTASSESISSSGSAASSGLSGSSASSGSSGSSASSGSASSGDSSSADSADSSSAASSGASVFEEHKVYKITYSSNPENTADITLSVLDNEIIEGQDCTVTVKALEGYAISEVTVNGSSVELSSAHTEDVMMHNGEFVQGATISGEFMLEDVSSDEDISVSTASTFDPDEEIKLTTKAGGKYKVTLTGTRKAFGKATSAKAEIIPDQEAQNLADSDETIPDNSEVVAAIDISLADADGNEVEPDGTINVGIDKILEEANEENSTEDLSLFHVKDDDTTENLDMSTEKDSSLGIGSNGVGFSTDSFSKFLILKLLTLTPTTITGSITLATDIWTEKDINNDSTNQNAIQFNIKQGGNTVFSTSSGSIIWKKSTSDTSTWIYTISGSMSIDATKAVTMDIVSGSPAKFKYVLSDNSTASIEGTISGSNNSYAFTATNTSDKVQAQTNTLTVNQNSVSDKAFSYHVECTDPYNDCSLENITIAAGNTSAVWNIPAGVYYTVTSVENADYITYSGLSTGKVSSSNTASVNFKRIKSVSPTFDVVWEDNNNANKNRPNSGKVTMKLQYKTTYGEYHDWSDGFAETEPTPTVNTEASVSNWTYTYKKIPLLTDNGTEITAYRMAETLDSTVPYINSYAADGITICNQETFDFTSYVDWNDIAAHSSGLKKPRPSVASSNLGIKLWAHTAGTGSQYATPTDITEKISFQWDNSSLSTNTYKYTINFPIYDTSDNPITYYCVPAAVTNAAAYISDGGTGKYEAPTCDNGQGAYGNVTDKCYDNGTISYVFTDTATISGTKKWIDGNAASGTRPAATLYLYRYTDVNGNSFGNGAAAQYTGAAKTDAFISQAVSPTGGAFTFPDAAATEAGKTLPKYDADGNRYVYYVEERFDSDNKGYSLNCVNEGAVDLGSYEGKVMLADGTIENSICELRDINIDKKWTAVADQSVVDATNLYIGLIRKSAKEGSSYEIVTSTSDSSKPYVLKYSGFTKDDLYKRNTFEYIPSTDDEGYAYTYSAFECTGDADGNINTGNIAFAQGTESDTISNISVLGTAGASAKLSDREVKIGNVQYAVTEAIVAKDSNDEYTAELDNKPAGKLNYIVNKVWGNDSSQTGNVKYRPTVTYTIWQRDYNGNSTAIKTGKSLTKTNYVTSEGNTWSSVYSSGSKTIDSYHLDRYDANGHEYTYYITETSTPEGYYQLPSTYSYDEATDTYTGTLNNTWGTGVLYKYVPVTKTWLDGGKVSLRQPVKLVLYKKNDSTGLITNANEEDLPSVTLNTSNGWQGSIGYNPSQYVCDTDESFVVREVSVGTDGSTHIVNYASDNDDNILTGTYTVPGTETTEDETYSVTVAKSENTWKITNKKTGTVGFVVHKLWHDNGLNSRNKLKLILKQNDNDYAVYEQTAADSYGDKTNFKAATDGNGYENTTASVKTNESNNEIVISFGSSLPKYDENGAPYTYTVSEKLYDTASSAWVNPPTVKYDATASDAIYNKTYTPYDGATQFTKTYVSEMVNTKAADPVSPKFYKKWIDDENSGNTRCDISLTLWRKIDKGTNDKDVIEAVPGYVQRVWTKDITTAEKKFSDWRVTFASIPSSVDADMVTKESELATYLGHDIHYYVTENMNVENDYVTSYYTGGAESDPYYLADTYKTTTTNSIYVAAKSAYASPENGVIVNRLYDKMNLKGVKIWHNMPSGTHQSVIDDISILFTLQYQLKATDTAKDYKYDEATGSLVEKDDGTKSVTANLTKDDNVYGYNFTTDGSYNGTQIDLPKYNDAGKKYIYSVKETFNNSTAAQNNELALLYPDPEISLTKDFKMINTYDASANKTKKINVFKYWNTTKWSEEGDAGNSVYPSVTYTLYRGDPGTEKYYDGNLPPAGKYEMVGRITKTGKEIKDALESNPANNKIYTWDNLPEYAANGKEYVYFVEEKKISGYIVYSKIGKNSPDEKPVNQFNVVQVEHDSARQNFNVAFRNCYTGVSSSYVTIEGQKNWYDSDGKTAYSKNKEWLPNLSQLSLKLQRSISGTNGSWTDVSCDIVCDDVNNTFKVCEKGSTTEKLKLHKFNSSGAAYSYRIVEPAPSGWTDYATHKIWQSFNENEEVIVKLRADKANNQNVLNVTINNKFGVDYSITKKWNDNMNNDGFRPTSVVFKLQYTIAETSGKADWSDGNVKDCTGDFIGSDAYNGTAAYNGSTLDLSDKVVMTVTPGDGNNNKKYSWNTVKFSSLPKYDTNGNLIHYRAIEVLADKYPVTDKKAASYFYIDGDWKYTDNTTTLVNSMDSTKATITKTWNDNNNDYNVRPTSLKVYLQRTTKSDYTKDGDGVITTPETDMGWEYVKTVTATDGVMRTLSAADNWTETVTYLPKVSPEGKTYTYRFTETPPTGAAELGSYKRESQTDKATGANFESAITNTIENVDQPKTRKLTVEKKWDNADYTSKPASTKIELLYSKYTAKNSSYTWSSYPTKKTAVLDDSNNWNCTWYDLPELDIYENKIIYKAVELDNSSKEIAEGKFWKDATLADTTKRDYKVSYQYDTAAGFTAPVSEPTYKKTYERITNRLSIADISGKKVWSDANGNDNTKRPEVTLTVYSDITGSKTALSPQPYIKWTKNGKTWTYSIADLPKYRNDGGFITYSIMEADIKGYTPDGGDTNGTCTHTVTCTDTDQISKFTVLAFNNILDSVQITGTKTWTDNSDIEKYRPSNADVITIEVYRKAEGAADWPENPQYRLSSRAGMTQSGTAKLVWNYSNNGSNTWSYSITGLPAYTYTSVDQDEADKWTYGVKELIGDIPYTAQTNDIITVSSGTANLTNTLMNLGELKISKALDMKGKADPNPMPSFDFIVKVQKSGYSAHLYNGAAVLYSSQDNTKIDDLTITDGRVRMKAGEYVMITRLPYGYTYSVAEIESPTDGYTEQSATGKSGTISSSESLAAFINRQGEPPKPPEPKKPESGDSGESKTDEKTTASPVKASTAASSGSSTGSSVLESGTSTSKTDTDSNGKKVYYDVNGNRVTKSFPGALFDAAGKQVRGAKRGHAINGEWLPGHGPLTGDLSDPGLWAGLLVTILAGLVVYLLLRFRKKKK